MPNPLFHLQDRVRPKKCHGFSGPQGTASGRQITSADQGILVLTSRTIPRTLEVLYREVMLSKKQQKMKNTLASISNIFAMH